MAFLRHYSLLSTDPSASPLPPPPPPPPPQTLIHTKQPRGHQGAEASGGEVAIIVGGAIFATIVNVLVIALAVLLGKRAADRREKRARDAEQAMTGQKPDMAPVPDNTAAVPQAAGN